MKVLVIGDLHAPFIHEKYFDFIRYIRDRFLCEKVISIGDIVDQHAINYHEHDPDGQSSGDEIDKTVGILTKWYNEFPVLQITKGNHDELPNRKAKTHGLSQRYIKSLNSVFEMPKKWTWHDDLIIDNVLYMHGTGKWGKYSHIAWANDNRISTVTGHAHSGGGVQYLASKVSIIFGMNVGCGIDIKSYAMAYGKNFARRPTIGCGVVLDGRTAFFCPMEM
jgi:predicted phosphodiesterase